MKVAALLSGGKDSCYNMLQCVRHGHEIVCLINLYPENTEKNEIDSFMYQTVGHNAIQAIADAMELPLLRFPISGKCVDSNLSYNPCKGDEVEDLYIALKAMKEQFPDVEGVSSGAILSNYQRARVENCCDRLGLISLAYMWECEQRSLLHDMLDAGLVAVVIKTATMGLDRRHIGKTLNELEPYLLSINQMYGCNPCGEGGEYETFTIDCPLFKKRIVFDDSEIIVYSDDMDAPVLLYVPHSWHLEDKNNETTVIDVLPNVKLMTGHNQHKTSSALNYKAMIQNQSDCIMAPISDLLEFIKTLKDSTLLTLILPLSVSLPSLSSLSSLSSLPLLQVVYSAAVTVPVLFYQPISSSLLTWKSRTLWCPPALTNYALIQKSERFLSIPMILPITSDSLIYACESLSDAYNLCKEYQHKMLMKISKSSYSCITTVLCNNQFRDDWTIPSKEVMITGWVDQCVQNCSMQVSCRGYFTDSYNDEFDEKEEILSDYYALQYGNYVHLTVKGFKTIADVNVSVEEGYKNHIVTLYINESKQITTQELQTLQTLQTRISCSQFLSLELNTVHPIIIPVEDLQLHVHGTTTDCAVVVEMSSYQ